MYYFFKLLKMSSYSADLETNWAIAGILAASGSFWAPMLVSGDMAIGAVTGGVAMAAGRLINVQIMGGSVEGQIKQTTMAALTGAATGAATVMLLNAVPAAGNLLGEYTNNVALAATVATANYYFDRSSIKNALSGM